MTTDDGMSRADPPDPSGWYEVPADSTTEFHLRHDDGTLLRLWFHYEWHLVIEPPLAAHHKQARYHYHLGTDKLPVAKNVAQSQYRMWKAGYPAEAPADAGYGYPAEGHPPVGEET